MTDETKPGSNRPELKPLSGAAFPSDELLPDLTVTGWRPAVRVYLTAAEIARAAAERLIAASESAIAARGRFTLVVSGGRTPLPLYDLLATADYLARLDWSRTHLFFADERCVPPDHKDSNYHLVQTRLIQYTGLPTGNVHRIAGEQEPAAAADAYDRLVRGFFERRGERLRFDAALLGMGADGHTASLTPGSPLLAETSRCAAATPEPYNGLHRVTLTYPALNAAALLLVLVTGADKAATLHRAMTEPINSAALPVQGLQPKTGTLLLLADRAAAGDLT